MAQPSACSMWTRVALAVVGVVLGVLIFVCFGFVYTNWNTAIWGLLSGVAAAITLGLHLWYRRDSVSSFKLWAHRLKPVMILGCFIQLAGICGLTAYLTIAILEHQALAPGGRGFYLTSLWCFMTWKWGFSLFLFARAYRRDFRGRYRMDPDVPYQQIG